MKKLSLSSNHINALANQILTSGKIIDEIDNKQYIYLSGKLNHIGVFNNEKILEIYILKGNYPINYLIDNKLFKKIKRMRLL